MSVGGAPSAVSETLLRATPFYTVTEIRRDGLLRAPTVVLVTPMSGHYAVLMRDLVIALASDHRVLTVDWVNARHVPAEAGAFGFADNIAAVVDALACAGPDAQLVGICQSVAPSLAAAIALHQTEDAVRPSSLALLGGPVDVDAAPTRVSRLLAATPRAWMAQYALATVPAAYPGAGRRVYPARTHHNNLLTYLARQIWRNGPLAQKVFADDGSDAARFPFVTVFSSVKDLPAQAFLESIEAIYQERRLPRGEMVWRGLRLQPRAVRDMALLTIEAERDDVAAPGQTVAAHRLLSNIPDALRSHRLLGSAGHFSLVHGVAARTEVAAALKTLAWTARRAGQSRCASG